MDNRAIGVFDSGVGGLTVLNELKKMLPNEKFIYFGDTKRVPYGNRSKDEIIEFSREIMNFLKEKDVKVCVIACNTVCSIAYNVLCKEFDMKIFNIVDSCIKELSKIEFDKIGVVATKGTINSKIYENGIKNISKDIEVYNVLAPLFVPIVEEGLVGTKISKNAVEYYLEDIKNKNLDYIVLGCTHYPFLKNDIKEMINNIKFIDPAKYTANDVKSYLEKANKCSITKGDIEFYVSGDENHFDKIKNKYIKEFKEYKTNKLTL